MPVGVPPPSKNVFRFALPPSLGATAARDRADVLEGFLGTALSQKAEVSVSQSYEALAKDILAGRVDAAWAPPFVCARLEAMGARAVTRGVRRGAASYRAAIVCLAEAKYTLETLKGSTAAWVDRDSVGGYLLALALFKAKGLDPNQLFFAQNFAGSYRAALEQVLTAKADVASIFAPSAGAKDAPATGAEEILPGSAAKVRVLGYSDESPNDGVVVAPGADPGMVVALEKALLSLDAAKDRSKLLSDVFTVDRFEAAPRMGYRALYRVAMASL